MIELYEQFHKIEVMKSVNVMSSEIDRCKLLIRNTKDAGFKDYLMERVDGLQIMLESVQSDITNEFLSPDDYLLHLKDYLKHENSNLNNASKSNLNEEHL